MTTTNEQQLIEQAAGEAEIPVDMARRVIYRADQDGWRLTDESAPTASLRHCLSGELAAVEDFLSEDDLRSLGRW